MKTAKIVQWLLFSSLVQGCLQKKKKCSYVFAQNELQSMDYVEKQCIF